MNVVNGIDVRNERATCLQVWYPSFTLVLPTTAATASISRKPRTPRPYSMATEGPVMPHVWMLTFVRYLVITAANEVLAK